MSNMATLAKMAELTSFFGGRSVVGHCSRGADGKYAIVFRSTTESSPTFSGYSIEQAEDAAMLWLVMQRDLDRLTDEEVLVH